MSRKYVWCYGPEPDINFSIFVDINQNQIKFEKIPTLRPVFEKEGTITAANASTLNDGASAQY